MRSRCAATSPAWCRAANVGGRGAAPEPLDPGPGVVAVVADDRQVEDGDGDLLAAAGRRRRSAGAAPRSCAGPSRGRARTLQASAHARGDPQGPALAAAADDDRERADRPRVAGGLGKGRPARRRTPWCRAPTARASSRPRRSRSSSRARSAGKRRPKAACSRSHQPAPSPQKARPPLSTSSVAAALAMMPGARNVTGVHSVPSRRSVPSPASARASPTARGSGPTRGRPAGSGSGGPSARCRRSPAASAASATPRSQPSGSSPQGKRADLEHHAEAGRRRLSGVAAPARRDRGRGLGVRDTTRRPSPRGELRPARRRIRRSWPSSTGAGTGRSRAALRARHTPAGVSKHHRDRRGARPRAPASPRQPGGPASRPSVSTTTVSPRRGRPATIWSSSRKASARRVEVGGPLPTTARKLVGRHDLRRRGSAAAAHVDFPEPDAPTSTHQSRVGYLHPGSLSGPAAGSDEFATRMESEPA